MYGKGDSLEQEQLSMHIKLLKWLCIWPAWRSDMPFLIGYYLCITLAITDIFYILVTVIVKLVIETLDIDDISILMYIGGCAASALFRYCYDFRRKSEYSCFAKNMREFLKKPTGFQYYTIITKEKQKLLNILCLVYYAAAEIIFQSTVYSELPLTSAIGLPTDYSFAKQQLYCIQQVGMFIVGHLHNCSDLFWMFIIFTVIEKLKVINEMLKHLGRKMAIDNSPKRITQVLSDCIQRHVQVRRIIADMEALLNPIILSDYLVVFNNVIFNILTISRMGDSHDTAKVLFSAQLVILAISHLFIFYYMADVLRTQEEILAKTLYDLPWYKYPNHTKMPLLMGLTMAMRPLKLTGGKFLCLSLAVFLKNMNTLYSIIVVVLQQTHKE